MGERDRVEDSGREGGSQFSESSKISLERF